MYALEGTCLEQLIKEAQKLKPDYSSKMPSIPGDERICIAPRIIGKYLALKRVYKQRAKEATTQEERDVCYEIQNILGQLADREFKWAIRMQPRRRDMYLRANGMIMYTRPPTVSSAG